MRIVHANRPRSGNTIITPKIVVERIGGGDEDSMIMVVVLLAVVKLDSVSNLSQQEFQIGSIRFHSVV